MTVCTEPLPNERVPKSTARLWSCRAPATISEAEAEPPLINTTSGFLGQITRPGVGASVVLGVAAARRDDFAALQKGVGNGNLPGQ